MGGIEQKKSRIYADGEGIPDALYKDAVDPKRKGNAPTKVFPSTKKEQIWRLSLSTQRLTPRNAIHLCGENSNEKFHNYHCPKDKPDVAGREISRRQDAPWLIHMRNSVSIYQLQCNNWNRNTIATSL